ncbi:hsp90 co-chaperone Cdc37 [Tyrophagus putrescentiae]|nr:hsp90 co-chaperone Cdc37 [Tyrophagus putrescentiae]
MVDYSKWKNIEISDDEDDTHPNIDTPSLFRWRHQARIERMEQLAQEKEQVEQKKKETQQKLEELKKKKAAADDQTVIENELKKLELQKKEVEVKEKELEKQERSTPWNVDTISKESWSKTMFNKPMPRKDRSQLTDEEQEKIYKDFVDKYESKIKEFAMLSKFDDLRNFLMQYQDLACEETSTYLTFWCLNLEIEGKHELMKHISRQAICLHYILELSKHMDIDPRGCVNAFFTRIQKADKEYMDAFEDEVKSFQERIQTRAKKRLEDAMKEVEEEERKQRLGPGGLDPQEVFESLPECLQKCFETRDIKLLQETILTLDVEEAKLHMKRCIDSGLWVPSPGEAEAINERSSSSTPTTPVEPEEPVYADTTVTSTTQ